MVFEDVIGWHDVQAGETLTSITEKYLGTWERWQDNWKLNADLKNPNRLYPGQRIRVITGVREIIPEPEPEPEPVIIEKEVPAQQALINKAFNKVDKNLRQSGWALAAPGDQLQAEDGVRTLAQSSAELEFDRDSRLTLTEYSQVFLRGYREGSVGIQRSAIEIESGSADLNLATIEPEAAEIEILVGETVSRPQRGADGRAQTRTQRAGDTVSKIMVYVGSSQVEAGGVTVDVPTGMGTAVEDGQAPSPPEKLLPRPLATQPEPGAQFKYANPVFIWSPIEGAAHYLVEVCRDPDCGTLLARTGNLTETTWAAEGLPTGKLFWRVTAVSPSGLEGFPGAPSELTVLSTDKAPPGNKGLLIVGLILLLFLIAIYVGWVMRTK